MSVCVEEVKLQLLAKSVLVPGLPNLLFSLIKSSGDSNSTAAGVRKVLWPVKPCQCVPSCR